MGLNSLSTDGLRVLPISGELSSNFISVIVITERSNYDFDAELITVFC